MKLLDSNEKVASILRTTFWQCQSVRRCDANIEKNGNYKNCEKIETIKNKKWKLYKPFKNGNYKNCSKMETI